MPPDFGSVPQSASVNRIFESPGAGEVLLEPRPRGALIAHPKLDLAAAVLIGAVFLCLMPWSRMIEAKNDFVHFYIGGMLYGHPDIFSPEENYAKQRELIGGVLDHSFFGRPAFYGLLLKPLTLLPYKTAYWVFQLGSVASLCVFLHLNRRRFSHLPILCAMSVPLFANFMNGQDVLYLLMFCSLSLYFTQRGWLLAAGMVMSLCAIKAHLFVLVPLAVIVHRKWRVLAGGVLGGVALGIAGLAGGLAVQFELVKQLGNPEHSPYPDLMPNLRSLTGDHHSAYLAAAIAVYLIVAYLIYTASSYEVAFGWALVGGLLGSFHAYIQDCLLLLLALVLLHGELAKLPKALFYIATLPFIYAALLAGHPYSAVFPSLLLACLALQLKSSYIQSRPPSVYLSSCQTYTPKCSKLGTLAISTPSARSCIPATAIQAEMGKK